MNKVKIIESSNELFNKLNQVLCDYLKEKFHYRYETSDILNITTSAISSLFHVVLVSLAKSTDGEDLGKNIKHFADSFIEFLEENVPGGVKVEFLDKKEK